jgi:AcrR family transcriptional regulator
MRLAAERDFAEIGLADVAAAADVSLATLRESYDGKLGILADFSRRLDRVVLEKGRAEGEAARDRLFEILMRRFDALIPNRPALRRLLHSARRDPFLARALHRIAKKSQMWMLVASHIHKGGIAGRIAIEGTVLVYAEALRVFLDDDDPGLARTMAALDRALSRGETAMHWLDRICSFLPDTGERVRRRTGGKRAML